MPDLSPEPSSGCFKKLNDSLKIMNPLSSIFTAHSSKYTTKKYMICCKYPSCLIKDFPKPKALNIHESKVDGIFV